jgi:hypothetical protein
MEDPIARGLAIICSFNTLVLLIWVQVLTKRIKILEDKEC